MKQTLVIVPTFNEKEKIDQLGGVKHFL